MSSAPFFTLFPAKKCVPRWRIKILPGFAVSPSKSLTPSRFDIESRPNRVEPAAFVLLIFYDNKKRISDKNKRSAQILSPASSHIVDLLNISL